MRVFGIGDLHLSFTSDKPMDRFGPHWKDHHERVRANWCRLVSDDDVVLVAGDHSWAMKLDEALPDLRWIADLPGIKIMGKGNHDLWWHSLSRLEQLALPATHWLHCSAKAFGPVAVCGTRGWSLPGNDPTPEDEKIYAREVERLKLSLTALDKLRAEHGDRIVASVCMMHYPPLQTDRRDTDFTRLLEEAHVDVCIYGHLHQSHSGRIARGVHRGVRYEVVSCDLIDFAPALLLDLPEPAAASA